jgi:hypothetical protein
MSRHFALRLTAPSPLRNYSFEDYGNFTTVLC